MRYRNILQAFLLNIFHFVLLKKAGTDRQILVKIPNINFYENHSGDSCALACVNSDGHEANNRFRQLL